MGRGASTPTAPAPVSRKQARHKAAVESTRSELSEVFPDHKLTRDLSEEEIRVLDPFDERRRELFSRTANVTHYGNGGWRLNNSPIRPYTSLYNYLPNMGSANGVWIESELRLDHETGHIIAYTEVSKRIKGLFNGGGSVSTYKMVDCGTDIEKAIQTGQQLYDDAWGQFKNSDMGKKARYVPSPWDKEPHDPLYDPSQPRGYRAEIFSADREIIHESLAAGIEAKQRFDAYIGEASEATAQLQNTAEALGYDLDIASLKPRTSMSN